MNRRRFLALAAAGIGHLGCGTRIPSGAIRVSVQPFFAMSGLYLAKELGYFEDLGLHIDITRIASSTQAIPLAAGGKQDVVFSSSSASLVNAIAKGARLRIVAGREIAAPTCPDFMVIYGRREAFPGGLQDVRLLEGKRVAADLTTSIGSFGIDMVLAGGGLTAEKLGILQMGRSELIVALLAGKVDAVFLSDFSKSYPGLSDRIVRGISLADVLPNHQVSFIIYGARLLDGDPDTGVRFLSAYLRGAKEYLAGKTPRFHDELAASNGMDPASARKVCRNTFVPDGRIDLPSLERFIQWASAKKLCPFAIQAEDLVDMRFLDKLSPSGKREGTADGAPAPQTMGVSL